MKDDVKTWLQRIGDGLVHRRQFGGEERWRKLEDTFYNKGRPSKSKSGPNLIASNGDSLLSYLAVPNPSILLKPRKSKFVESGQILEGLDAWFMEELEVPWEFEDAILNAYLFGVGIIKIGYDSEFGFSREYETSPGSGATFTSFDSKGRKIEFIRSAPGMVWVKSVLPHDIVVPWGTRTFDEAPWVAHRIVRHVEDARADPKYVGNRTLQPNCSLQAFVESYSNVTRAGYTRDRVQMKGESEVEFVELWEIHDRRDKVVKVLSQDHPSWLRKEEDLLQIDGLPFVELRFTPKARSFWVTSDADYLQGAQAELDDITTQASKQRRASVLKFLYAKGALTEDAITRLLDADVGAALGVEESHNPKDAIVPFNNSPPTNIYADAEYIRRTSREIIGFSRNQAGEYESSGRRTATEAEIVDRGSQRRMSRKQIELARAYTRLFRKINQTVFKFWNTDKVARVVGEEGLESWIEFSGEDLVGEYAYSVRFTSEPLESTTQRKSEALQIFTTLLQTGLVDPDALIEYIETAFNDADITRILKGHVQNADVSLPMSGQSGTSGRSETPQNPTSES